MNEQRLRQLRERHKHNMSPAQLNDLANLIEALIPDTKTWPPAGVVIEVSHDGCGWYTRVSAGDGNYYTSNKDVERIYHWKHWRYAPAPWQNVSEDMQQWAVFSDGTTDWSTDTDYWHVGDNNSGFATCIHVENRPEGV